VAEKQAKVSMQVQYTGDSPHTYTSSNAYTYIIAALIAIRYMRLFSMSVGRQEQNAFVSCKTF